MAESPYAAPRAVTDIADCSYYHSMDIPGHGEVQGFFDLRGSFEEYLGPVDFAGKRVLEIGPGSGFLTFEMEKRGAEVVSVELSEDLPWDFVPYDHPQFEEWLVGHRAFMDRQRNGYWFAHRAFRSKAKVHYGSAYQLPEAMGRFQIATMAAVLLHNRDPLGILTNCARITDEHLVIVDQFNRDLAEHPGPDMRLVPNRHNDMVHTWWHIAPELLVQYLPVLGFEVVHQSRHVPEFCSVPGQPGEPLEHFTVIAERRSSGSIPQAR